jgi:hypothetical protein
MHVGAVGLQTYEIRIPEGLMSALRTESRSRRSRVLMMSTEGKGITCVSMPVCATDRRPATSCAREDGATAVLFRRCASARARQGWESARQEHRPWRNWADARCCETCSDDRVVLQPENAVGAVPAHINAIAGQSAVRHGASRAPPRLPLRPLPRDPEAQGFLPLVESSASRQFTAGSAPRHEQAARGRVPQWTSRALRGDGHERHA